MTTKKFFSCLALLIFFNGCMTVDFTAYEVPVPVILNSRIGRPYKIVTHFIIDQERKALFLSRLVGAGEPDINEMIKKQLKATPGDAVINVRIHGETQAGDVVLPVIVGIAGTFVFPYFALFIVEPLFADLKTYTVEGDVIMFTDIPEPKQLLKQLDPNTGLPIEEKNEKKVEFDPETGQPIK